MRRISRYALDTSALLALRDDESGAERVHRVIDEARKHRAVVYVSFMTRMELLYRIAASEGEEAAAAALRLLDALPLQWVTCEPFILTESARIKQRGGLSVADAWIAATAILRSAVLVHKDPEFATLADLSQEHVAHRNPRARICAKFSARGIRGAALTPKPAHRRRPSVSR